MMWVDCYEKKALLAKQSLAKIEFYTFEIQTHHKFPPSLIIPVVWKAKMSNKHKLEEYWWGHQGEKQAR